MQTSPFHNSDVIDRVLQFLGAVLDRVLSPPVDIVVVGGAALNVLGYVSRPTRDIDALSISERDSSGLRLLKVNQLPSTLKAAIAEVALAADLPDDWLNSGPTELLDYGMPDGFEDRLIRKEYGSTLRVYFAHRQDLIAMKVYAAADSGAGRHTQDLTALEATCAELHDGARWARKHDPSFAFFGELCAVLRFMGCPDAAEVLADEYGAGA